MRSRHYNNKKKNGITPRLVACIIVAVLLVIYIVASAVWPLPRVEAIVEYNDGNEVDAQDVSLPWPSYGQSALYGSGYGLLASNGSDQPIPIASITKVITVLTVLDKKPLGIDPSQDTITFTTQDTDLYNSYLARQGTVGPVTPGQTITRENMVRITLISSANNYADRLAIDAFGSLEAFVVAAEDFIDTAGLQKTTIADASGFSPNSVSTATELVQIGALLLENNLLAETVDTQSLTIENLGTFRNTNFLLARQDTASGIKTGTTDEAGSCLLFAATERVGEADITIIGATLGGPNGLQVAADADTLLDSTFANFTPQELIKSNTLIGSYNVPWSEPVNILVKSDLQYTHWIGNAIQSSITTDELDPGSPYSAIGSVSFTVNEVVINESDLVTETGITKPSIWWCLTNPLDIFFTSQYN